MLAVLLCLFSGTALKLSDPAHLRVQVEENASLKAWCRGVGCVQPFTPASCLSWCNWNEDKQSDAEHRGAFAGKHWGKAQMQATEFGFYFLAATTCTDEKLYHFTKNGSPFKEKAWIFPGGDAETKLETTEIQCNKCFLVSQVDGTRVFIRLTKDGVDNQLSQWSYDAAWAGDTAAMCTCAAANVWTLPPGLSTVDGSKPAPRDNGNADVCIGLKNLIWPKACPAEPAVVHTECGKLKDTTTRLTGQTARCAGTCKACVTGTYATTDKGTCADKTDCGNQQDGTTRLTDNSAIAAGTCADCTGGFSATLGSDDCA